MAEKGNKQIWCQIRKGQLNINGQTKRSALNLKTPMRDLTINCKLKYK